LKYFLNKKLKIITFLDKMEDFTKPSITRLARRAGVKTMSDDCYSTISNLIALKLDKIISNIVTVNNSRGTKTVMIDDLIDTLNLMNVHIPKSTDLNKSTK
jgi:histone H3/H4